jgi:hypothetical protein
MFIADSKHQQYVGWCRLMSVLMEMEVGMEKGRYFCLWWFGVGGGGGVVEQSLTCDEGKVVNVYYTVPFLLPAVQADITLTAERVHYVGRRQMSSLIT